MIEHTNEVPLSPQGDHAVIDLCIHVTEIGSVVHARVGAYGMTWGYDAQLDTLGRACSPRRERRHEARQNLPAVDAYLELS